LQAAVLAAVTQLRIGQVKAVAVLVVLGQPLILLLQLVQTLQFKSVLVAQAQ
jgi:hypothetical protein